MTPAQKYLAQRVAKAEAALKVAIDRRMGSSVIHRRRRDHIMAVAKYAAATPAAKVA